MNPKLSQALASVHQHASLLTIQRLSNEAETLRRTSAEVKRALAEANESLEDAEADACIYLEHLQASMEANRRKRAHIRKLEAAIALYRRPWWQRAADVVLGWFAPPARKQYVFNWDV
ncbi:hypothetical protein [Bordetella bronchiseptica]|uniref:hypothetical protein n=1 Tax=Bordetella bronchiseptica TaxID=518 RepID=UPI00046180D5|nr:hypothetical protein [Bordetella bronchiseptica]KDD18756.1 hypothetical protein L522_4185 [Bordetella bronchiseptica MBORD707]